MKKTSVRYRGLKERSLRVRPRMLDFLLLAIVLVLLAGDMFILSALIFQEDWMAVLGAWVLLGAFLPSMALSVLPVEANRARTADSLALISAITLVAVALPSMIDPFVDTVVLVSLFFVAVLLTRAKFIDLPKGMVGGGLLFPVLIVIPATLALGETLLLSTSLTTLYGREMLPYLIPIAALFGFLQEMVFRGGVQKNLEPVGGPALSIVVAAILDAGFMSLWGVPEFIILSFFGSVAIGYVFYKSRSVTLVGMIRASSCGWLMVLAYFMV